MSKIIEDQYIGIHHDLENAIIRQDVNQIESILSSSALQVFRGGFATFVSSNGYYGMTPVSLAIATGNITIIESILKFGPHVMQWGNYDIDSNRPIAYAIAGGNKEIVKLLLGVTYKDVVVKELQMPDSSGCTPMIGAIYRGNKEIVELLIEAVGDEFESLFDSSILKRCGNKVIKAMEQNSLGIAGLGQNQIEIAKLLIDKLNITKMMNASNYYGGTSPMSRVALSKNQEIKKLVFEKLASESLMFLEDRSEIATAYDQVEQCDENDNDNVNCDEFIN